MNGPTTTTEKDSPDDDASASTNAAADERRKIIRGIMTNASFTSAEKHAKVQAHMAASFSEKRTDGATKEEEENDADGSQKAAAEAKKKAPLPPPKPPSSSLSSSSSDYEARIARKTASETTGGGRGKEIVNDDDDDDDRIARKAASSGADAGGPPLGGTAAAASLSGQRFEERLARKMSDASGGGAPGTFDVVSTALPSKSNKTKPMMKNDQQRDCLDQRITAKMEQTGRTIGPTSGTCSDSAIASELSKASEASSCASTARASFDERLGRKMAEANSSSDGHQNDIESPPVKYKNESPVLKSEKKKALILMSEQHQDNIEQRIAAKMERSGRSGALSPSSSTSAGSSAKGKASGASSESQDESASLGLLLAERETSTASLLQGDGDGDEEEKEEGEGEEEEEGGKYMVKATLVEETDEIDLPMAVDAKPINKKRRRLVIGGIFAFFVAVNAIIFGVVFGVVLKEEDPDPTAVPSSVPSLPPTDVPSAPPSSAPSSPPTSTVQNLLAAVAPGGGAAFDDEASPQFRALTFVETNPVVPRGGVRNGNVSSLEDFDYEGRTIRRYALATLFYSTGGGDGSWTNRDGWLTAEDECDWYSNHGEDVCDDDGALSASSTSI